MDTRPRTLLISFCTVQLWTLCTAHSLANLCLFTTSGQDPGELPGFWGSMVFCHAPIPRKGSGNQQQQHFAFDTCGITKRLSQRLDPLRHVHWPKKMLLIIYAYFSGKAFAVFFILCVKPRTIQSTMYQPNASFRTLLLQRARKLLSLGPTKNIIATQLCNVLALQKQTFK